MRMPTKPSLMRKKQKTALLLVLLAGCLPSICVAQVFNEVSFCYDANGNRVSNSVRFGRDTENGLISDTMFVSRLSDELGGAEVRLFPNPTHGVFTVSMICGNTCNVRATLSTVGGVPLEEKKMKNGAVEFDLSDRSAGLYLVTLTLNGTTKSWRVMKR